MFIVTLVFENVSRKDLVQYDKKWECPPDHDQGQASNEQEQFAEAGKMCVRILSKLQMDSYRSYPDFNE